MRREQVRDRDRRDRAFVDRGAQQVVGEHAQRSVRAPRLRGCRVVEVHGEGGGRGDLEGEALHLMLGTTLARLMTTSNASGDSKLVRS
jgi:hypothetical protein